MAPRGLRGAFNQAPIMPRGVGFSDGQWKNSSPAGGTPEKLQRPGVKFSEGWRLSASGGTIGVPWTITAPWCRGVSGTITALWCRGVSGGPHQACIVQRGGVCLTTWPKTTASTSHHHPGTLSRNLPGWQWLFKRVVSQHSIARHTPTLQQLTTLFTRYETECIFI